MMLGIDERTEEGRTWIEMELVRQTLIAVEKMKKNGDLLPRESSVCGHRFCMKGGTESFLLPIGEDEE